MRSDTARLLARSFPSPTVTRHGGTDPGAPLVVLLHGRGSDESEIIRLASHLPAGPEYVAVRAPIAEGGGYAWFANRGIGRPVAESLATTMAWFRAWLDDEAPAGRPVVLVGFSGGAAFAGGLALTDPGRYAGVAILYGTLPFEAGVAVERGRLAHLPVLVAQGEDDHVIPRELLDRTWRYLLTRSGAPTTAVRGPGGHGISGTALHRLGVWISTRGQHLSAHGPAPVGVPDHVEWPTLPHGRLPQREGDPPEVSWTIPQQQVTQNAPAALQEALFERIGALNGVAVGASRISVPGARAFTLHGARGPEHAFLVPEVAEFAHLHPPYDGSLHVALPVDQAADLAARGWGVPHPWAGTRLAPGFALVYGPRTPTEVDVVAGIVAGSHAYATGRAG